MNKKKFTTSKLNISMLYFLSFLIPLAIMVVFFYESKIFPFGDFSYLEGDLFQQYMPFLYSFKNKLDNHSSFDYTWDLGLGTGYHAIYAYYLASPTNWILKFISPEHIVDYTNIIIAIKISLCGLTFFHYIRITYGEANFLTLAISLCYSLSSYMCVYCFNIIWLDGLLLFPLIILGLDMMYHQNKHLLYFITLTISIFSNYYISIIICLFCLLYFLSLIVFNDKNKTRKERFIFTKNFFIYSLIAGMACAVIIIPSAYALSSSSEEFLEFPKNIEFYIPTWDFLMRTLITVPKSINDSFPNLYCSVIILITLPSYILNNKINIRTKLRNLSLICFMLISFNCNVLDFIWHGFHFPNCICARNAFIYVFLILTISYEALTKISKLNKFSLYTCIIIPVFFLILTWSFKINKKNTLVLYNEKTIYLSLFFIILFSVICLFLYNIKSRQNIVYFFLLVIISYELYMNGGAIIGSTSTRSALITQIDANNNLLSKINDSDTEFYRIADVSGMMPTNCGAINSYNSVSFFSSTANNNVKKTYKALGMGAWTNYYTFAGHTPVTSTLFDIKYILNDLEIESGSLTPVAYYNYSYLYEYKYAGSLGFMVNDSFEQAISLKEKNPFVNLNSIYKNITGDTEPIFNYINVNSGKTEHTFTVPDKGEVYFKYSTSPYDLEVTITKTSGETETKFVSYSLGSRISSLGILDKGDIVKIKLIDDDSKYFYSNVYAYVFDEDKMHTFTSAVNSSPLNISHYDEKGIKGTVDAASKGLLFTTIPFDNGWSAYVDGKKIEINAFNNAFISIPLDAGEHTIHLTYNTVYKKTGIIVSIISILAFIAIETYSFIRKRKSQ